MNRNIDDLGRIVIPKEMRTELGISNGDPVHIELKDNKIILTKPGKTAEEKLNKIMKIIELNQYNYGYQIKEQILEDE